MRRFNGVSAFGIAQAGEAPNLKSYCADLAHAADAE